MKNKLIILLTILGLGKGFSQEISSALLLKVGESTDSQKAYTRVLDNLGTMNNIYIPYLLENEDIEYVDHAKVAELPSKRAIVTRQQIYRSDINKLKIKTTKDTSGYITSATASLLYDIEYHSTIVDIPTGQVVKILKSSLKEKVSTSDGFTYSIKLDVGKIFGSKKKLASAQNNWSHYQKKVGRIYGSKINDALNKNRAILLNKIRSFLWDLRDEIDDAVYLVEKQPKEKGYTKKLVVSRQDTNKITLVKNELVQVYTPVKIGNRKTLEYVTYLTVKEVKDNKAICGKNFIQSKKKFSKRLDISDQLYGVNSYLDAHQIISNNELKKVNVYIEDPENQMSSFDYESLVRQPSIRVFDRNLESILDKLRLLYKDERFIDLSVDQYQDKQLGVDYIITLGQKNLNVTNVATGELVSSGKSNSMFSMLGGGISAAQAVKIALLQLTEQKIEFLEVKDQKKGKVKRIKMYHPFGFDAGTKMKLSILKDESVGGKTIQRKEELDDAYVTFEKEFPNVGIMKIGRKYRKKLYQAIQDGEELYFDYANKK